jgi:hypothetical protein
LTPVDAWGLALGSEEGFSTCDFSVFANLKPPRKLLN